MTITLKREEAQQVLDAIEQLTAGDEIDLHLIKLLRARLAQPEPEPVSLKQIAAERGINMPETYVPTMDDAVAAADGVLMNEQASLLRECRAALDSLIQQKPSLAGLHCGSTTLGNLKASLYGYRPQGVFGNTAPPQREWQGLTDEEISDIWGEPLDVMYSGHYGAIRAIEAKLKDKNAN